MAQALQVTSFDRGVTPIVVAAVGKTNRRFNEFHRVDIVKRRQLNCDIVTANLRNMPSCKRAYAAVLAEQMMADLVIELVVGQFTLARQQPKSGGLDDRVPVSRLGANGAVALVRACTEIEVGFELNGTAMATATVGLEHENL